MKRIETVGPFRFITKGENIKPIIQELYNENIFFKKIVDSNKLKVDVFFEDKIFEKLNKEEDDDISVEGFYDNINRKISLRHNCKDLKTNLIHEYIHFIQDCNIRKHFPGLSIYKILSKDTLYNFALSILFETDAYTKDYICSMNTDYVNKYDMKNILNYEINLLFYKYNLWGYAEMFDFTNMKKNGFSKETFIEIADCILKSLTDDEFGGKIFPQYDVDWMYIFEELKKAYITNRNFDAIAISHNYNDTELMSIFDKKFSGNITLIKNFLLNYNNKIYYNKEKLIKQKKER